MTKGKAVTTIETKTVGNKSVKKLARELKGVSKNTRSIKNNMNGLRNTFFAIFGGIGIRQITQASDSISLLRDRITVFAGDAKTANETLSDLFQSAQDTNTSVENLAETYNRVALATKELGLSSKELIGFTQTLQNTFRLSGSTIAESSAAAIQLSQGLASGQLRGQELRSVLEQNAVIGQILADTLGTTRGQLIKFAESGKITSEVVLKSLQERTLALNEQAKKLGQTFEQSFIKIGNKLKQKIFEINDEFKVSEKFAKVVNTALEDIDNTMTNLAIVTLPLLTTAFVALFTALKGGAIFAALTNPITGISIALTAIGLWVNNNSTKVKIAINDLRISFNEFKLELLEINKIVNEKIVNTFGKLSEDKLKKMNDRIDKSKDFIKALKKEGVSLEKQLKSQGKVVKKTTGALGAYADANIKGSSATLKMSESLSFLNAQWSQGEISLAEYNRRLDELKEKDIGKQFRDGKINVQQYRDGLIQIKDINDTFQEKVFSSLEIGAQRYTEKIGTMTSNMASLFESSFGKLEDAIFQATKTGSLNFSDFTQSILDDLLKVIIRMTIVNDLARSLAGGSAGSSSSNFDLSNSTARGGFTAVAAKGGVFQNGKQSAFASGGIVSAPTTFPMSNGTGLMGEAGPEAIVPLKRTSSGDLGVQATPSNVVVNVNNEIGSDAQVGVTETTSNNGTRSIDISITRAVNNALNSGRFDKSLSTNFGVNRKGSR